MPVYLSSQSYGGNWIGLLTGAVFVVVILGLALYADFVKGQGE